MSLIDREALIAEYDRVHFFAPGGARKLIVDAPEVRPEPRPRGRWITMSDIDGDYYCCSQCGGELPRYSLNTPTWDDPYTYLRSIDKTNFCPNCGSDNREGEQDG